MPHQCACAKEIQYLIYVCVCMCVCVTLISQRTLKTKQWPCSTRKHNNIMSNKQCRDF